MALVMGDEVPVCLFHVAVRNSGVDEFFSVGLVSQTRIKLHGMGLGVQQEVVDVSEIGGFFNSGDQQLANTNPSVRAAHRHAANLGRGAVIPQYSTRGPDRSAVSQCNKMKSFIIMLIALQIERNVLFGYKDRYPDPKTLFDILRRGCGSDGYHAVPGAGYRFG